MRKDTILVIEDERELSHALNVILDFNGFRVLLARTGTKALELIKEEPIDLILCDINLPDFSGHQILEKVRNEKDTYRIPFIFLTALSDDNDVRIGMNEGADDYITKPFISKELIKTIKSRLEIKKKNDSIYYEEINEKWLSLLDISFKQEFLTPLSGILNATHLIGSSDFTFSASDIKDTLNAIYVSSFSMFRNTRNLLVLNTIKHSTFEKNNKHKIFGYLNDVINQIINGYSIDSSNTNNKRVVCKIEFFDEYIGSLDYVNIIFTELIDNAIKFSISNEPPVLKLLNKNGKFEFTITNSVSENLYFTLDDISEFKRFKNAVEMGTKGLGIGLYLCKELCTKLNFEFKMEIEAGYITFLVKSN